MRRNPFKFRVRRRQGRKTYGSRFLRLTSTRHVSHTLGSDAQGDWVGQKVEMDNPGTWIPSESEMDIMKLARFNSCDTKQLVSGHVFLTDVKYMDYLEGEGVTDYKAITQPGDLKFQTYHDPYIMDAGTIPTGSHFLIKNGVASKLTRGQAKYHSVWKARFSARKYESEQLANLSTKSWKEQTIEYNLVNRTAEDGATGTRYNADFVIHFNSMFPPTIMDTTYKGVVKYTLNFTTTWKLVGSKPT